MTTSDPNDASSKADGAFTGALDQETFRALLFNSFINQQAQTRAQRREGERLAAVAKTNRDAAQAPDLRAALNLIVARALEVTGATGAAIAIARQGQVVCCAVNGPTAPPLGVSVPMDSGLSGECLRSGRPIFCHETSNDPRVNQEACGQLGGVRSILLVPLLRRRNQVGILEVFATRPSSFDELDQHALELLAAIAASALADFDASEPPRMARSLSAGTRTSSPPLSPA